MKRIDWVPGVVATPNVFNIPASAPDIDTVIEVLVTRVPQAVAAHVAAGPLAHAATAVAVAHAGCAVDAHADHGHDFATLGINAGLPLAIGWDAIAPPTQMEDAGPAALHTLAGGGGTGIQDATIAAHAVNPQPNNHTGADILASFDDHAQADVATALADHGGVDPDIGAVVVTRQTARSIFLDTSIEIHDIVTLSYHEVGARILVA